MDIAEERISKFEDISTETTKTENRREKGLKKNRTEYLETTGQVQKV